MKKTLKKSIIRIILLFFKIAKLLKIYNFFIENILFVINNKIINVDIKNNLFLKFYSPNALCDYRCKTFFSKEPQTLEWIKKFNRNSVFWDVGANIGLYSCYAAKLVDAKVYSFEPSFFNLELLAKNINLNKLSNSIIIVPVALNDRDGYEDFTMSSTDYGAALSTYKLDTGHDGNKLNKIFSYKTTGFRGDSLIKISNFDKPNYLKMDVDGIDDLVLQGIEFNLDQCHSILIEANKNFQDQFISIQNFMKKNSYILELETRLSDDYSSHAYNSFNQIYKKI